MPTSDQTSSVSSAIAKIRDAESKLLQAGRNTNDPAELTKINNEHSLLDSTLNQLVQAEVITDDAAFATAAATLKAETGVLQTQANDIGKVVSDVALAGQIAKDITQAITFLSKL